MVGGGCPPPRSPRCRGRAGAQSAPASPLMSLTSPGIPLPGTVAGFPSGKLSCMSWAPPVLYINTKSGQKRVRQTTSGWNLLVQWKNGTQEWVPLKILKNLDPIEVDEFSVARGIDKEPAFTWCIPYTLRCRDRIIAGVN